MSVMTVATLANDLEKRVADPGGVPARQLRLVPRDGNRSFDERPAGIGKDLDERTLEGPLPNNIDRPALRFVEHEPESLCASLLRRRKVIEGCEDIRDILQREVFVRPDVEPVGGTTKGDEFRPGKLAAQFMRHGIGFLEIGVPAKLLFQSFTPFDIPTGRNEVPSAVIGGTGKRTSGVFLVVMVAGRDARGVRGVCVDILATGGASRDNTPFERMRAVFGGEFLDTMESALINGMGDHAFKYSIITRHKISGEAA